MVQKETPEAVSLSALKNDSRPLSTILCYEGAWSDGAYKTWEDFLAGTALLRLQIEAVKGDKWLLHCEDCWYFFLGFTALLQCKKEIILSSNVSPEYLAEIRGNAPFLTDMVSSKENTQGNIFFIPAMLNTVSNDTYQETPPAINAEETSIIIYTSGSTGQPKAIKQRLKELESDVSSTLFKWSEELFERKLCTTVSQHHLYGLIYTILLPFTIGIPFRRKRIDYPEELKKLICAKYAVITVPAFLKRTVEIPDHFIEFKEHKSLWIFSSGGVLEVELAKKTGEVLGSWPVEGYGSTETSGIAWRQSLNGLEWTPLKNVQLSIAEDGCLVVRSPFINNPAGFKTSDICELLADGRFLLKGRIDSVVKIEEKRISLPEIENRIMQSGLAYDVCVISMEGNRQYLAAAIVFNNKGKEKFDGLEKNDINKFWREYLSQYLENVVIPKKWRYLSALPVDTVGKKKKEDIKLLFNSVHPSDPASE